MKNFLFLLSLIFIISACSSEFNGISPKEYIEQNNLNTTELENGVFIQIEEPGDSQRAALDEVVLLDFRGIIANTGETIVDVEDATGLYSNLLLGWQVGLREIGVGGKCTLVLPPDQAFGEQEINDVPPNSTLVFELSLKDIFSTATIDEYIARNNLSTIVLDKGVQMVILEEGNDVKPQVISEIKVNYTGKLTNELVFDRGEEAVLNLGDLIEGWQIALPEIGEGGKCILIIPSEVGYGATGAGNGLVPPNAPLVFEIELLKVGSEADDYVEQNNLNTELLSSGVHIIVHDEGNVDKKPNINSTVRATYEGRLTDGTVFDSGTNVAFPLNGVIKGWQVGLQEIGEGGSCTLIIPASAGYGSSQVGAIPPNSVLIFDVELETVN